MDNLEKKTYFISGLLKLLNDLDLGIVMSHRRKRDARRSTTIGGPNVLSRAVDQAQEADQQAKVSNNFQEMRGIQQYNSCMTH